MIKLPLIHKIKQDKISYRIRLVIMGEKYSYSEKLFDDAEFLLNRS